MVSSTQQQAAGNSRERLIESHLPLVKSLARRYAGPGAELDDLVQVGAVGLIKASDRFDPRKGVAFATFATPTIEGEIRHHLRDRGTGMRIPRQLQHLGRQIRRSQSELTVSLGRSPTVAEIAAGLKIDEADVEQALVAERARDSVPLDAEDGAAGGPEEPSAGSDNRLTLASTMQTLDERERRIIYLRFHVDKTERQIAKELDISQAHVSRLLTGALSKLRDGLDAAAANHGDITAKRVVSPAPSRRAQEKRARQQPKQRRGGSGGDARNEGRRHLVQDVELRSAIEAWLASERAAETPSTEPPPAASEPTSRIPSGEAEASERKPGPSHSGRFLVRMPSTLHEQLAQAAERDHVSLNRFVTEALAATVSPTDAPPTPEPDASEDGPSQVQGPATPPPARTIRLVLAANLAMVVLALAVAIVLIVLALERGI